MPLAAVAVAGCFRGLECHLSAEGFGPLLPTAAAVIPVSRLTGVARIDSRVGIEIVAIGEVWK